MPGKSWAISSRCAPAIAKASRRRPSTSFRTRRALTAIPACCPNARAYEVGLRFGPTQGWFLDVAAFRRDSSNLIDFVSCPAGPAPHPPLCAGGSRPFGTSANNKRTRAGGNEVEGGGRLNEGF